MASNRNLKQMMTSSWDGCTVLHVGEMEIWDGADLALLRETMTRLVEEEHCRSMGVDMKFVKYVPSGFFGMLYDWYERGVCIRLFSPMPHVQRMLWFTKFFRSIADGAHQLFPDVQEALGSDEDVELDHEEIESPLRTRVETDGADKHELSFTGNWED